MYPIVRKEKLQNNIVLMEIKAPRVAKECLPGQFIIAKTDEFGERIPLTICHCAADSAVNKIACRVCQQSKCSYKSALKDNIKPQTVGKKAF